MDEPILVMRVPLSLPCQVPVMPGTPDAEAPIEDRTERCAVDAWWMIGRALICDHHLRLVLSPDQYAHVAEGVPLNDRELLPWAEMHRYPQDLAHPVGS